MDIPGYRIERRIAEGGMSSVYLALQESLKRHVVLKVLKRFENPDHAARFLSEARTVAALQHRHVITIHDVGNAGDRHYIAMEYLQGGSLQERIDRGMQAGAALELLEDIAGCLQYVHGRQVVHGDIKPSNILFHADGTPKLSDFGIARQFDGDGACARQCVTFGSPYYLCPEQAEGRPLDGRSDLYALGIVFYQMLTGRLPYAEGSHIETIVAHLSHPIPLLPDALARYQGLLEGMLAKRPQDRFDSAERLVEEIRRLRRAPLRSVVEAISGLKGVGSGVLDRATRRLRRPPVTIRVLATGVMAVMAITVLVVHFARHDPEQEASVGMPRVVAFAGDEAADDRLPQIDQPSPVAKQVASAAAPGPAPTGSSAAQPTAQGSIAVAGPPPAPGRLQPGTAAVMSAGLSTVGAESDDDGPGPEARDADPRPVAVSAPAVDETRGAPRRSTWAVAAADAVEPSVDAAEAAGGGQQASAQVGGESEPAEQGAGGSDGTGDEAQLVDSLMQAGDKALQAYRLTTPVEDSAFTYYTKVLQLEPQHPGAMAGIDKVAGRYVVLARKALRGGAFRRAELYAQRGLAIRAEDPDLLAVRGEIVSAQQMQSARQLAAATAPPPSPAPAEDTGLRGREGTGNIFKDFGNVLRSIFD